MKKFFCWNKMSKDTLNNLLFTLAAVLILISSVLVMEHQAYSHFGRIGQSIRVVFGKIFGAHFFCNLVLSMYLSTFRPSCERG
jgi:hypothetical protein